MRTKLQNTVFSGQRRGFWSKIFIWRNIQWASTSIARERNLVWVTRRLLSALPEIAGGKRSAYRHIGTTAPSVSEKPPQGALHQSANQRQTEQLSCWHWSAGRSNVFSAGKTAFRKRGRNGSPLFRKIKCCGCRGWTTFAVLLWKSFRVSLYTVNTMQEKSLSTDGGFSFLGSIQEVIKFCE